MTVARSELVIAARRWIGTPFHHQASLCQIGCDCLGLVRGVWREVIGPEPEETPPYGVDWAATKRADHLKDALARHFHSHDKPDYRAGDVLLFRFRPHGPATHLGVATSPTHMVHAHSGANVTETTIGAPWRKRLVGAFIFPGVID
jgi:NlpC/P60 family putative phage cell wall peptidase